MKSYGDHMGNGHEPGDQMAEAKGCHADFAKGAEGCGHDLQFNPSVSEKQRRFMGAELARKRRGEKTQTGMSEDQLEDFARKGGRR